MHDPYGMTADEVNARMEHKARVIAENTAALESAYVEHENVMRAFDLTISFLERIADTPALERLLLDLRAQRETADRLLFTGGSELRRDEMTMRIP